MDLVYCYHDTPYRSTNYVSIEGKMKIPRKAKIGAYTYKVVRKHKLKMDGQDMDGYCDRENKIIYLDKSLKGIEQFSVFIHECLHAIELIYEVNLSEKKIRILEHALSALLIDNKIIPNADRT